MFNVKSDLLLAVIIVVVPVVVFVVVVVVVVVVILAYLALPIWQQSGQKNMWPEPVQTRDAPM